MKNVLIALLPLALFACTKDHLATNNEGSVTLPAMRTINLQNATVRYLQPKSIDLNQDGSTDFVFKLQLVGDPVLQVDRRQFCAQSGIARNLLLNEQDETPTFNQGATIDLQRGGFNWWQVGHTVLAEKIVGATDSWWDGLWKTAQHKYLAVQVQQGSDRYMGWIELSIDQASETMTLHRAALNLSPNVAIVAGN